LWASVGVWVPGTHTILLSRHHMTVIFCQYFVKIGKVGGVGERAEEKSF